MERSYGPPSPPVRETLILLRDALLCEYRAEYLPAHRRSPRRSRRLRRIRAWSRDLSCLVARVDRVTQQTLLRIEQETGHAFRDPDGLVRLMLSHSARRFFGRLSAGALPAPARDLAVLESASDAQALAIIGDVTLQVKTPPGTHLEPQDLVALCDQWGLYEDRIGLPVGQHPLDEEKATLARAVLGLIYIEGGADALRAAVPLPVRNPVI